MTINRTTLLDLPLPVTGTESNTWGDVTNNGLSQYVDIAIAGMNSLTSSDFTTGALTISLTEGDASATNIAAGTAQYATIKVSSLAQNSTITAPASARSYRIINADATYNLIIKASGQTGVTFLPGTTGLVAFNGTDYEIVGVVGPASATDNAVVRFDSTTGQVIQNSGVTIDDSNNVSGVAQLNATTADLTNIEVTNIKAKDGTAAATIADATGVVSLSANPVLSGGTANGVAYLNGSKVLTTGSALTFDGTNLGVGTAASYKLHVSGTGTVSSRTYATDATGDASFFVGNNDGKLAGPLVYGSTKTAYGALGSNETAFYSNTSTSIMADGASAVIKFAAGGNTEGMRLTSTGLGIGTSSPGAKVEAAGASTNDIIKLTRTGSTAGSGFIYANANDMFGVHDGTRYPFQIKQLAPTGSLILDSSGNLGLGVTPSAWSSAYRVMEYGVAGGNYGEVWGSSNTDGGANAYGQVGIGNNISQGTNYAGNGAASAYLQSGSRHAWFTAPSGTAGNTITFTQAMTLDASGYLGIGTTSPTSRLHVAGDFASNGSDITLQNTGTSGRTWRIGDGVGGYSSSLVFFDASASVARMVIDSSGNLLVGGTAARGTTVGAAHLDLFNGTAPAGTLTNGISLYSSSGDFLFMDAAGNGYKVGYRNVPAVGTKTGSYTLATGDVGKYVQVGSGGSITIPDATFAEGDVVSIFNNTSGGITITCTITTAYIAGTDSDKASVTLATRGVATILFISSTVCVISGNVS